MRLSQNWTYDIFDEERFVVKSKCDLNYFKKEEDRRDEEVSRILRGEERRSKREEESKLLTESERVKL